MPQCFFSARGGRFDIPCAIDFTAFFSEKAADFVGRDWLFSRQVVFFLASVSSGLFQNEIPLTSVEQFAAGAAADRKRKRALLVLGDPGTGNTLPPRVPWVPILSTMSLSGYSLSVFSNLKVSKSENLAFFHGAHALSRKISVCSLSGESLSCWHAGRGCLPFLSSR